MRRDVVFVLVIAAVAGGVRTYPAWNNVFTDAGMAFLETDSWYHVRLIENQVRNFPWRVTLDPYAAAGGQFVPIAPLFDTLTSLAVVGMHGRGAEGVTVERTAALMPPLLGTLSIIAIWLLACRLFDRRAGLLAAALLAVLPGHFFDRTMLGFVDHHALEALLALTTLLAFTGSLTPGSSRYWPAAAGLSLGLYLLAWASGAFLVAVLGVWLVLVALWSRNADAVRHAALVTLVACVLAFAGVAAFQDPRMHRYAGQLVGLLGLGCVALVIERARGERRRVIPLLALVAGVAALGAVLLVPDLVSSLMIDLGRLAPDPTRMGVLEARPLFLYSGEWRWSQPWAFFRTGFYVGVVALVLFGVRVWRERRDADLLILTFVTATFIATVGQNRFGYYLVTGCALLGGWLATAVLDWGGVPHVDNPDATPRTRLPLAREVAVVLVAGAMFAPHLAPRVLLAERASSFPAYWRDTMTWLRQHTPPPFARAGESGANGDAFYFARYSRDHAVAPKYTIMNWWDQGYWITQNARRVPVANPTQARAPNSARFYAATTESDALQILNQERAEFVVSDWELPFRKLPNGAIMGRFQNVVDWAGGSHAEYYEIFYRRDSHGWTPIWVFHEPYYRSMAYRLSVTGGAAATPADSTSVVTFVDRIDDRGLRFRELLTEETYATFQLARDRAAAHGRQALVVGLDPWQTAFPLDALQSLVQAYEARTEGPRATEAPWVRVFSVRP